MGPTGATGAQGSSADVTVLTAQIMELRSAVSTLAAQLANTQAAAKKHDSTDFADSMTTIPNWKA